MARLNTLIGNNEDADEEFISGSPRSKAENSNEEDEADGADMSAIINIASGKKTPPATATPTSSARPLVVFQKLFSSLIPKKPAGQSDPVPDNAPLEEHILTPENAKASGTDDASRSDPASVPLSGGKSLIRPSKIHYDMNVEPRSNVYDILEDEQAPQTRRSSRRQGRGSEGVGSSKHSILEDEDEDEEFHDEKESANEQDQEPSLAISESAELPNKTVNDSKSKIGDDHKGDDNASSRDEAAEQQDETVPKTRSRGRPRKPVASASTKSQQNSAQAKRGRGRPAKAKDDVSTQVPKASKRKAQEDADENEEGQLEAFIDKSEKLVEKPKRSSKRQKVDDTPAGSTRSKQQNQSAQQPQEALREESSELDESHDKGVDSILRSPTPEAQVQPTASRRGKASGPNLVSEGREVPQSLDTDENEEDHEIRVEGEVGDEAGDEIEGVNLQELERGPITKADIKSMRELMRNVGAGIKNGELSQQDKPEIATNLGKRISNLTSMAIKKHRDVIQKAKEEDDSDALQHTHDSINKYLQAIEKPVAKIIDSKLLEDKAHELRFKMITDLYAYNIPDLVELVSVSFESYKNDNSELETPAIIKIRTILGHLVSLCTVARGQPKNLQPKISGCQLGNPTRHLLPVVRNLLKRCTKEIEMKAKEEKVAKWRAGAPERERKRVAEEAERRALAPASGSQTNPHSSTPRRFKLPPTQVMPEEELTDIQRAAKAEKLAYYTAEKAKKADLDARRLANEADANPFDKHLLEKAEDAEQSARSALDKAIDADNKMVELALVLNLKPGPSHIDSLLQRSGSVRPKLDSRVKRKQTLGRHNLHVPVTSEWNDQELLIMVNGLQAIPGNEKYTMIEENLPHRSRQEILDKAKEFQRDQIEAWHEIRRKNPSCKPLPQWIYSISRDS